MMGRFKNQGIVPQGMLAPSGYAQDVSVNPVVQSTTRPAGTLLRPSPGFDSVRVGKNRFQGKGPTGGFRQFEFAEDIGGSGAALAVQPGDTSSIAATEWLPESLEQIDPGTLIIADRNYEIASAARQHEGHHTMPDMGDRSPGRPLSRMLFNPIKVFREDYQENPVVTVLASAGIVLLAFMVGNDVERQYRSRRGGGIASEVTAVPAAGAAATGDTTADVVDKIGEAGDKAVEAIEGAANNAVEAITSTGESVKKEITGSGE
jgi:hypothetical protein